MRSALLGLALAVCLSNSGMAQERTGPVTLGVLTDMTSKHARIAGVGSVVAAELAIEDRGGLALGGPVRLLSADHAGRADIALSTARRWYDQEAVEAIVDIPNAGIALAVNNLAGQRRKLALFSSPMVDRISGRGCNGHGIAWTWSSQALLRTAIQARLRQGEQDFFLVAADQGVGRIWEAAAREAANALGATIAGTAWHAYGATDFAGVVADARAATARTILVTLTGADLVNFLRAAKESGLPGKTLSALYLFEHDIADLGLDLMQDVEFATAFAWQRDDRSRAFADRFRSRVGMTPTMLQAGVYSAVLNWLKAVDAARTTESAAVTARLHAARIDDAFARGGRLLPNGRMVHDMVLMRVKTPAESSGPGDLTRILATVPGDQAFRSVAESQCPVANYEMEGLYPGPVALAR
jgi:branched-chain amino acid transport system substrate-binding protein